MTIPIDEAKADKPERTPEGTLALSDERFFKEGACHALALELATAFERKGALSSFHYIPSRQHEGIAEHVVVKCGDGYFDVNFGPQSEAELIARWASRTAGVLRPVGHPGWLSCKSDLNEFKSYLCLHIESAWLARARARAKDFISRNKDRFGL